MALPLPGTFELPVESALLGNPKPRPELRGAELEEANGGGGISPPAVGKCTPCPLVDGGEVLELGHA